MVDIVWVSIGLFGLLWLPTLFAYKAFRNRQKGISIGMRGTWLTNPNNPSYWLSQMRQQEH